MTNSKRFWTHEEDLWLDEIVRDENLYPWYEIRKKYKSKFNKDRTINALISRKVYLFIPSPRKGRRI